MVTKTVTPTQQAIDQQRESLASHFIGIRERKYRATKNPVHALRAYRTARHLRVPIPAWVLEVLDTIAKKPEAPLVPSDGGPSAVSQADTDDRDYAIIQRVNILVRHPNTRLRVTGENGAIARVAREYNVSPDRVRAIYYGRWRRPGDPL